VAVSSLSSSPVVAVLVFLEFLAGGASSDNVVSLSLLPAYSNGLIK